MVHVFERRLARRVCFYISHITHMPFGCVRPRMRLLGRIKVSAGGSSIGCAAIAELMDMKTMIARSQAGDFRPDLYPSATSVNVTVPVTLLPAVGCSTATAFKGADDFSSGVWALAVKGLTTKNISAINKAWNEFILASLFRKTR